MTYLFSKEKLKKDMVKSFRNSVYESNPMKEMRNREGLLG